MDPMTWAYLALMLASTGANYAAQRKVSHARERAMAAAALQRETQSKRSEAAAKSTADTLLATKNAEKAKAAEIESSYNAPPAQAPTPVAQAQAALLSANAPKGSTTVQEAARVGARNSAFRTEQNKLGSQLSAFGDVMLGNQASVERNRQDINNAGSALRNYNQYVLPSALNAANNAGKQWATTADVLKLAAAVMGPYALGGTPAAGNAGGAGGLVNVGASGGGASSLGPYFMRRAPNIASLDMGYPVL